MPAFAVHPRLVTDTVAITDWPLSRVLLMNDRNFPWVVLVPRRENAREIHALSAGDRVQLMEEITLVSRSLEKLYEPDKMNVGALGNLVPQLHVHVIARFKRDPAWPGSVWGAISSKPYAQDELQSVLHRLRQAFDAAG